MRRRQTGVSAEKASFEPRANSLGAALKDSDPHNSSRQNARSGDSGEFSAAMARLEKAVQEIVTVTTDQLSERATSLLDDTTQRLESELRIRRVTDSPDVDADRSRRGRRRRYRHRLVDRAERVNPSSGRLYRDPANQKIGGVCAGVARYFGLQTWGVRLGALSGLLFLPGIFFPAYWIAYFIMDKPEPNDGEPSKRRGRRGRSHRAEAKSDKGSRGTGSRGPAEQPQPFVAGRDLRYTNADLTEAELRLRRLESFITSDQYELHKELAKIEREHPTITATQTGQSDAR
jgi:phage shock protein C